MAQCELYKLRQLEIFVLTDLYLLVKEHGTMSRDGDAHALLKCSSM